MADERTAEQVAADAQLREAIQAVAEAYTEDGSSWVATEYVAVYSMQRWTEEGDALAAVGTAVDGDSVPLHRQLGLVEYAAARYRRLVMQPFCEADE